ncbi:DUF4815 domain-containing protein [Candidatus Tokpelaia sp.]|uniref:DUF4815 domain-containing protein n=1 Tax=Candidatus Tokpelaia sp. TaxID=2233777 RepID=UPI00123ADFE4|nr:DUF4815 domain-containing protein [Candidatus Tokpelaia sp.]KAA6405670.1 DUF4815 domain-containing protein [Candidatus Tokpelaia sp.]
MNKKQPRITAISATQHKSGLPDVYDRAEGRKNWQSVVFGGRNRFIQAAELNESQTIMRGRHNRLGRLVAKEGDRIERADCLIDTETGRVTLLAGKIYVSGDIFPVEEAIFENVPMQGRVELGVALERHYLTAEEDPNLLGQVPGSLAEGEPGAAREVVRCYWSFSADGQSEFYPVYVLADGVVLDNKGPSLLEPAMQAIATYDRAHGSYVVKGCRVTGLGRNGKNQVFSIQEGEANISGFKRTRRAAFRLEEEEDWNEAAVPGETHTYPGGVQYTFSTDKFPIGVINSILLTKEKTVSLTRGAVKHGQDSLPDNSVIALVAVKQGATTYKEKTDYIRTGNSVDWAPLGDEPASGSTYEVTYRFRDAVKPVAQDAKTVTVAGGATNGDIIISYTFKMPRIDRIGLQIDGAPIYIKGLSAKEFPAPPIVPEDVLSLATITNDWLGTPIVKNDAYRSIPYADLQRLVDRVGDMDRLLQLERLRNGIDSREPVAKKGMFVDPFLDQTYRDAGQEQTAAVSGGVMELPITSNFYQLPLAAPVTLAWQEEVIIAQEQMTGCTKINPYANFTPLPADLALMPAADFWTQYRTDWAGAVTNEYWQGGRRRGPLLESSSTSENLGSHTEQIQYLRQIELTFTLRGLGAGEILDSLTFDGISVLPGDLPPADENGRIQGSFTIPANIPAGTKEILAISRSGTNAGAMWTGQGTIEVTTLRQVTTVRRWRRISSDPQAQLFLPDIPRQIIGVDFHICKIGNQANGLLVEQVSVDNGYPTTDILAQASFPMANAATGWAKARYSLPVTTGNDGLSAFVIKTDDNEHSVSFAKLGEFDAEKQQWVTSHPYIVGPRFSSVNAATWTAHQDEALTFRLVAARYSETQKLVNLGEFALDDVSDIQIRAGVELPSSDCSVVFEVERPSGTIYQLLPMQVLHLTEYVSETIKIRAILKGTETLSPVLYAPVELVTGHIAESATYISRAFALGENARIAAYIKAFLPGGAGLEMNVSIDGGGWQALELGDVEQLSEPLWTERKYEAQSLSGRQAQLKLTIKGSPAARICLGDFGAGIF